ncbi:calcium-binding protein P-like [Etheostoma cragini]|uniref:calcium-binding protein P-like n=1 Tax=Etheostoma cragini TaxID=417921 RepID=UPI00155DFA34|nr:calcium-binding protein P-like [Etheostoma cragini]
MLGSGAAGRPRGTHLSVGLSPGSSRGVSAHSTGETPSGSAALPVQVYQEVPSSSASSSPGNRSMLNINEQRSLRLSQTCTRSPETMEEPANQEPGEPANQQPGEPATQQPGEPANQQPGEPANQQPGEPATQQPGEPANQIDCVLFRPGLSSGVFVSTGDPLQESVYSSRGQYEDLPSSSRPRPVGGSTGAQLHHLTQVGLSSQIAAFPGVGRSVSGPTGSSWNQQHSDQDLSRPGASRESVLSFPEFSSSVFQMSSSSLRDASAPPLLMTSPPPEYPPEDASPSAHTSASLIKAIREELRRLAQKQVSVTSYP